MKLTIDGDDFAGAIVERDGVENEYGRQGFDVMLRGFQIHFYDELDAEMLAVLILRRQGVSPDAIAGPIP